MGSCRVFVPPLTRLVSATHCSSIIVSGLEASRAPYSKSHARRLKRNERERLAGGGMESLKYALPSITTLIADGNSGGSKSAGQDDHTSPAISTVAATSTGPSAKLDPKSESGDALVPDPAAPSPPPTRLGQIGQGQDTPLTRSQRRRALWVIFFFPLHPLFLEKRDDRCFFFFLSWPHRKAVRFRQPLIRADPAFAANPFGTIRTHAQNTLVPRPATT